jgi:hypothetical protein
MTRTITRLFDDYEDAEAAVNELERMGIPHRDLSLIANNTDNRRGLGGTDHHHHDHHHDHDHDHDHHHDHDHGAIGGGASTGAVVGGVGGLLAGLGLLAIPGLGPIVAAGWLASTAVGAAVGGGVGAAAGGLVDALKHAGHSDEEANVYSEGVRRGGTLVSARVSDDQVGEAEAVLDGNGGVTADTRGSDYRRAGWSRFDASAEPYTSEQIERERDVYRREPSEI